MTIARATSRSATPRLRSFLHPRSIAVVGASSIPGKVGHTVLRNLLAARFPGNLYPVNSGRKSVMELETYPSVSSLPETPELVIIVTPAVTVHGVVQECASRKVPAALIISAGFRETGSNGLRL